MKVFNLVSSLSIPGVYHLVAAHGSLLHRPHVGRSSPSYNSTGSLIDKAIDALGGEAALNAIKTYQISA